MSATYASEFARGYKNADLDIRYLGWREMGSDRVLWSGSDHPWGHSIPFGWRVTVSTLQAARLLGVCRD